MMDDESQEPWQLVQMSDRSWTARGFDGFDGPKTDRTFEGSVSLHLRPHSLSLSFLHISFFFRPVRL